MMGVLSASRNKRSVCRNSNVVFALNRSAHWSVLFTPLARHPHQGLCLALICRARGDTRSAWIVLGSASAQHLKTQTMVDVSFLSAVRNATSPGQIGPSVIKRLLGSLLQIGRASCRERV